MLLLGFVGLKLGFWAPKMSGNAPKLALGEPDPAWAAKKHQNSPFSMKIPEAAASTRQKPAPSRF